MFFVCGLTYTVPYKMVEGWVFEANKFKEDRRSVQFLLVGYTVFQLDVRVCACAYACGGYTIAFVGEDVQ